MEDPKKVPKWRWPHLAVLGAVAFVFGVLAWNIWKGGAA